MCSGYYGAPGEQYREIFARLFKDKIEYFRYWTHDAAMTVSTDRDAELQRIQRLLARCAHHYASCYESFVDIVPYDERVLEILSWTREQPYHLGTFRPDYVICEDGSIKVCEITSRFFGNGYFYSFFMDNTGRELANKADVTDATSRIEEMLQFFAELAEGMNKLVVLKSADKSDSIPLYVPFYRYLGLTPTVVEAHDADCFAADNKTLVISALSQKDLLTLSDETIRRYIDAEGRNDLRTVLLLHDKRFLALIYNDAFCRTCLNEEETSFLRAHVIRTYVRNHDIEVWEHARNNKDGYIIKHARLGKSEKVYAGCLASVEQWQSYFDSPEIENMTLQPFQQQKLFQASWRGNRLLEYICGTILCVDDEYYGTGNFRASTCPVINIADDTKVAPLVTNQAERLDHHYAL